MSASPRTPYQIRAEAEIRRRRQLEDPYAPSVDAFTEATMLENVQDDQVSIVPFTLWPTQRDVLARMQAERLLVILKARQLGISWLACADVLYECTQKRNQVWLLFSQGQLEANELIKRIGFLYEHHRERARLPALTTSNTAELGWANHSRVMSLPATKRAGRSWTASGIILDEFAFMAWGKTLLSGVKPTIDGGGKLFIISSADGNGSPYHQHCQQAKGGSNGYTFVFLPWQANTTRGPAWREERLAETADASEVYREYPENDIEAFTHAAGLVYGTVWRDGPPDGNVTDDAEYIQGAGPILWGLDDGYSAGSATKTGGMLPELGMYAADSHPRVFLLMQQKPDGHLDVFAEHYACLTLSDQHIEIVKALAYPEPDYVVHGPGAAEIRGRIQAAGMYARQSTANVAESIKVLRDWLAPDANQWRRLRVHPRCMQVRKEMAAYRYEPDTEIPLKQFDHGPDALRGMTWTLRGEGYQP